MNDDWDSASKATPPDTLNVAQTPQPKRKRPIVPDNLVLDNSVTPEDKPHTEEDTHIPHLAQSDWDSVSSATPTNSTPDDWDSVSEPQPAPQPRLVPPDNLVFTAPDPLSLPVAPPIPPEPALYVEDGFLPLPPLLRRRRRFSMNKPLLFSILAVLLVIGGSIGAFQGIRIYNANIAATATIQAGATVSAQTNATATATAQAVPTVTTEQQIYNQATSRTPAVDDPLSDDRNSWGVFTTAWGGQCAFTGGAYHLSLSKVGYWLVCTGGSMGVLKSSVNFALQVQISIVQGNYGGIIFGADTTPGGASNAYRIDISPVGAYLLYQIQNKQSLLLQQGLDPAIKTGLNQPNVITIIVKNSNFYLYANSQFVISQKLTAYTPGEGDFEALSPDQPTDVAFSNLKIWSVA